jgi:hypothetical protein
MKNVGIICYLPYTRSIVISIYYYAIKNIYGNVRIIEKPSDLDGLDIVIIGNDHFGYHTLIWDNDEFVNKCNNNNIQVIVIGAEKIKNTVYPHNEKLLNTLSKIKNLKHYVWDVEDAKLLNKEILGYAPSLYYKNCVDTKNKKNKCLFIGQYQPSQYEERRKILSTINNYIETDIITDFQGDWKDYLQLYAGYKYALCPISGTSNAIPFRFYEAMLVDTIPILQVRSDTLAYHSDESKLKDCIFFQQADELKDILLNFNADRCHSKLWLEDKIINKFTKDEIFLP